MLNFAKAIGALALFGAMFIVLASAIVVVPWLFVAGKWYIATPILVGICLWWFFANAGGKPGEPRNDYGVL